tara:strand:+ start:3073 stop:3483 length:411 start_codon:yes stop_codon:yes gene_type:complete
VIREKLIFGFFVLTICLVFRDTMSFMLPSFKKQPQSQNTLDEYREEVELSEGGQSVLSFLSTSAWGNDIFYDRTDIYDNWFTLTGITEFSDGRKAIINNEILRLNERVRGFTVKQITENNVVLKRNEYYVTLNLVQ